MAKTQEDAGQLIFDCNCRNLVTHIIENKAQRENLYIIGVPCMGLAGKAALIKAAGNEILSMEDQGDHLILETKTGKKKVARTEVLQSNCRTCIQKNPVIFDELAGTPG